MDATHENTFVNQMNAYQANSRKLQLQAFKIDTVLGMMNNCADTCHLVYKETGVQDADNEQVTCFNNCIGKAYKLAASASLQ